MNNHDKVAVVTGVAGAHGRAAALALADRGLRVVALDELFDLDAQLEVLVERKQIVRHVLSLEDIGAVQGAVDAAAHRFGRVDVLVNAVCEPGPDALKDVTEDAWHRCVRVNMKLPFFALQACARHMRAVGGGRVVNLSSTMSGFSDGQSQVVLGIAKAGVNSMSRQWAVDLSPDNIQANSVWLGHDDPEALPAPTLVAALVTWLALDAPEFINGTQIVADGGAALFRQGRMLRSEQSSTRETT